MGKGEAQKQECSILWCAGGLGFERVRRRERLYECLGKSMCRMRQQEKDVSLSCNDSYSICLTAYGPRCLSKCRQRTSTAISLRFSDARHDMIQPPYPEPLLGEAVTADCGLQSRGFKEQQRRMGCSIASGDVILLLVLANASQVFQRF